MQKIKRFLADVGGARKRTGILYATEDFEKVLKFCVAAGYTLVEATNQHLDSVIQNDEELIKKIKLGASDRPIIYIGLEAFVGPRFEDAGFVEQLGRKLIVEEPIHPVVLLLYSRKLFHLFANLYNSSLTHQNHVLDLTAEEPTEDDYT
jgi:hypothetical protein